MSESPKPQTTSRKIVTTIASLLISGTGALVGYTLMGVLFGR